jgi:tetratricopeptide (TPR) repeat protein
MESFGQLLSRYIRRTGISDAELARAVGVRRQTIFRWKEGLTARPRHREDVLRCADKLRLSPQERDQLLLAAGFAPQAPATPPPPAPPAPSPAARGGPSPLKALRSRRGRWIGAAGLVILALLSGWILMRPAGWPNQTPSVAPAAPGETLVIVSRFANYAEQVGYNVAGRIRDALQEEFASEALIDGRVAIWSQPLTERDDVVEIGRAHGATLVIWGEYDSGRVLANFTLPAEAHPEPAQREEQGHTRRTVRQVTTPAELSAAINVDLPTTARWVALVSLGQVHYAEGRYPQALAAFERALSYPPGDESSLASVTFPLGYIYGHQGDLDQAIAYYTRAIAEDPSLASAYNNRGAAYLERGGQNDLQRAVSDFGQAIELDPTFAAPYFNRGLAYFALGEAYDRQSLADLQRAHALQPQACGPTNALCWELSLLGRPEDALPYCEDAVAADPTPRSRDSRGLAYALLGRTEEAIEDFEAFVAWLDTQPQDIQTRYLARRRAWIEALRGGSNPIGEETLRALRAE